MADPIPQPERPPALYDRLSPDLNRVWDVTAEAAVLLNQSGHLDVAGRLMGALQQLEIAILRKEADHG